MVRHTGKRIAAGMICLILLLSAGCSGKNEENSSQSGTKKEAGTEEDTGKSDTESGREEQKQLKQAFRPQFLPDGIRSVSLKRDGEEFLHISRQPAEYKMSFDYWEILKPYDENITMNTEVMFEMFEELCSLTFDTPAQAGEGTDTGITDSGDGFTVEYVDTMDHELAQSTEEADTSAEVILGNEDGNGGRYAAIAGNEEQVCILPEAVLQMIYGRKPFDYILKIPVLISADTLKDVEISTDGRQYEIQVDTKADSYKFGKKKVEKEEFASLYQAVSGIMLASEKEEESTKKGEAELTVVYHRNKKNAPDVQVSYYSYDDEFDSVEIDGKEWFLVKKEDVEALAEQIKEAF